MSPYKAHCLEEFCSNYPSSRKPMWGVEFNFSGDELPVKALLTRKMSFLLTRKLLSILEIASVQMKWYDSSFRSCNR
ncbi:hypothetical protein Tco_1153051 [Tanacetum coccineum]